MKIICVGRNYTEHAKELNNPIPTEPILFMKPSSSLLRDNEDFYYPEWTKNLHYEAEIVLRISKNGKYIDPKFAHKYYDAITVGIDFTARDIQDKLKAKGQPWEIAKAFDGAAPIGRWLEIGSIKNFEPDAIDFSLKKNGENVQIGNTKEMIFSFSAILEYASRFFRLQMGDIIFTGTPAGVGATQIGDKLEGFIGHESLLTCVIK